MDTLILYSVSADGLQITGKFSYEENGEKRTQAIEDWLKEIKETDCIICNDNGDKIIDDIMTKLLEMKNSQ